MDAIKITLVILGTGGWIVLAWLAYQLQKERYYWRRHVDRARRGGDGDSVAETKDGRVLTNAATPANPLAGVCMGCRREYRPGKYPASHGFCAECAAKRIAELNEERMQIC